MFFASIPRFIDYLVTYLLRKHRNIFVFLVACYSGFSVLFLMLSGISPFTFIVILAFGLYILINLVSRLMNDPDNVKCPNCKCTRVDNQVLKQENLGIAGQNHTYFSTVLEQPINVLNVIISSSLNVIELYRY